MYASFEAHEMLGDDSNKTQTVNYSIVCKTVFCDFFFYQFFFSIDCDQALQVSTVKVSMASPDHSTYIGNVNGEGINRFEKHVDAPQQFVGQNFFAIVSCFFAGNNLDADDMVSVRRNTALSGITISKFDGATVSGSCTVQFILWQVFLYWMEESVIYLMLCRDAVTQVDDLYYTNVISTSSNPKLALAEPISNAWLLPTRASPYVSASNTTATPIGLRPLLDTNKHITELELPPGFSDKDIFSTQVNCVGGFF